MAGGPKWMVPCEQCPAICFAHSDQKPDPAARRAQFRAEDLVPQRRRQLPEQKVHHLGRVEVTLGLIMCRLVHATVAGS